MYHKKWYIQWGQAKRRVIDPFSGRAMPVAADKLFKGKKIKIKIHMGDVRV